MNLPLYKCHKTVAAAKIINIDTERAPEGGAVLVLDDPRVKVGGILPTVAVDAAWLARNPAATEGGYYVVYVENADQYTTYSPAGPFESGYTREG